ncbi:MAG TPA: HAD-IIA family hydrolase [Ktedonobacteraceae bacterium]|nr:HAD-IIA family hydrolase [Ktedonobacteraceae bacterium]
MLPYTTYLIDLDGVIYRGNELLPGAKEFIAWLKANNKKFLFLTNNSFASETQVLEKLIGLGIVTDTSHLLSAGEAAVQNIARRFPGALVYLVGEQPLSDLLRQYQLQVADVDSYEADVVLVGLDRHFDYKKLTGAVLAVRAGAHFITINRDPLLPVEGGFLPGCGTMAAAIEAGCGVTPEVVGKPEPLLLQEAMRMLGSNPSETVMIGDSLTVDIQGGKAAGTQTLLVLSGNTSREDVAHSSIKPDYIYQDVAALLADLKL